MSKGRDILAHAAAGSGKTATFSIGILAQVDATLDAVQAIVLAPTRDLVQQSEKVLRTMARPCRVRVSAFFGGTSVGSCLRSLRYDRPQVVVASPGRLAHLVREGRLDMRHVRVLVFDEADALVSDTFCADAAQIAQAAPRDVQVALFSATMPAEAQDVARTFLRDPVVLLSVGEELARDNVRQFYLQVCTGAGGDDGRPLSWRARNELRLAGVEEVARRLVAAGSSASGQVMVFARQCRDIDAVADALQRGGLTGVDVVHSRLDKGRQQAVVEAFAKGRCRVLVCTDMLARGVDVPAVSTVINVGMPASLDRYVHRVGRCGRFQRQGISVAVVTNSDMPKLREIESTFGARVRPLLPSSSLRL